MPKKKVEYATKEDLTVYLKKEGTFLAVFCIAVAVSLAFLLVGVNYTDKKIDALNKSAGEVYEKCREAGLTNYFYKRTNGCDVPKDTNLFNSPFLTTTHDEGEIFNQTFDVYYSGKPFHYNCEYKKTGEKIMFCTKPLLCEKRIITKTEVEDYEKPDCSMATKFYDENGTLIGMSGCAEGRVKIFPAEVEICWEKPKQETELKEKEHQTYTECRNKDLCYSLIRRRCVSC